MKRNDAETVRVWAQGFQWRVNPRILSVDAALVDSYIFLRWFCGVRMETAHQAEEHVTSEQPPATIRREMTSCLLMRSESNDRRRISMKKTTNQSLTKLADAAFKQAAKKVIERARESGTPVIVWENESVTRIEPQKKKPSASRPKRTP